MKLHNLIREAHGCAMPTVATHFVEDLGDDILYDVYLWDFGVKISVPFRGVWIASMQELERVEFNPKTYKVRAQDAVAYALMTYNTQPEPVREYLRGRFGPKLREARGMAHGYWGIDVV